ncbi:MAG: hypothetical protein WKF77_00795 [Planctomycetaceae bacterium]
MFRSKTELARFAFYVVVAALLSSLWTASVNAGMPALLPSSWTAESSPERASSGDAVSAGAVALRIQAISFFLAMFLLSGWLVKGLWNLARRDFKKLPTLSYGRSLALVTLWGLAFVVVLTMISGARELMTPGAWRKQGWTYTLANAGPEDTTSRREARQRGLEQLRTALWQYAAMHDGKFPGADEPSIESALWEVPGWPGLKFLAVPDCRAESTGRLFVFEPDAEGDERLVLLTNGFIGTMRTAEINQSLAELRAEPSQGTTL